MGRYDELIEEFRVRADFYRMLSRFYYAPLNQDEIDNMDVEALRDLSEATDNALMAKGFNDMARYLGRQHTGTRQELNSDYTGCFGGTRTYEFLYAVPYGSVFLSPSGELMGEERSKVLKVYKSHRVKLQDGYDLPEDHLAFELEYLGILNDRAASALEGNDPAAALQCVADQEEFLSEHINTWFGRLFNLSFRLIRTRFYKGVLRVTKGFFQEEGDSLQSLGAALSAA